MNNKATFSLFLSPVFSQVSSEDKRIFSLFLEKVIQIAYNCNHVILKRYIYIYMYVYMYVCIQSDISLNMIILGYN